MKVILSLLLLVSVLFQVNATLYGITFGRNDTISFLETVQINETGDFTHLVQNFVFVNTEVMYFSGISGFDPKQGLLYFATDFEAPFIYGVDINKNALLPPMFLYSLSIKHIVMDPVGEQLLVTGLYFNHTFAITSIPYYGGAAQQMINFTGLGVHGITDATFDAENRIYYLSYYGNDFNHYLGQFSLSDPEAFKSMPFPCNTPFSDQYIFYDNNIDAIVGLGITARAYHYFQISNGECSIGATIPLVGNINCATYDPTEGDLYLSFTNGSYPLLNNYIGKFNAKSSSFSAVSIPSMITNLGVSYKM